MPSPRAWFLRATWTAPAGLVGRGSIDALLGLGRLPGRPAAAEPAGRPRLPGPRHRSVGRGGARLEDELGTDLPHRLGLRLRRQPTRRPRPALPAQGCDG